MSMYLFSISTDQHVPLKLLMTKYFIIINHRYILMRVNVLLNNIY